MSSVPQRGLDPRLHPSLVRTHTPGSPAWAGALLGARSLAVRLSEWPVRSHRRAVRNAMIASTSLLERRIEREEVEHFLDTVTTPAPQSDATAAQG